MSKEFSSDKDKTKTFPKPTLRDFFELYLGDHAFLRIFIKNLHKIDDQMWRSVQPDAGDIKKYSKMGIKTIINLRGESKKGFYNIEKYHCQEYGIENIDFKLTSRQLPTREKINQLADLYKNIKYPALIHCKSGADRAGIGACLYQILQNKTPVKKASKQLSIKYGHISSGKTGILDYMFERYLLAYPSEETSFVDWVNNEYDPRIFKLDYPKSPLSDFITGTLLRRE